MTGRLLERLARAVKDQRNCPCVDDKLRLRLATAILDRRRAMRAHQALVRDIVNSARPVPEIQTPAPPLGLPRAYAAPIAFKA